MKGTKTEQNLIEAFREEAHAAMVYEYNAFRADVEGHNALANTLRASANIRHHQAFGNLNFMQTNPLTGKSSRVTRLNLESAIQNATRMYLEVYPKMAEQARLDGQDELADWFETLAKAERMEANLYENEIKRLLD